MLTLTPCRRLSPSLLRETTAAVSTSNTRYRARARYARASSTSAPPAEGPLKLAIVGAGPSGFYTASRILSLLPADTQQGSSTQIHMYERLPTPYGLARYGVAPDHPEVKVGHSLSSVFLRPLPGAKGCLAMLLSEILTVHRTVNINSMSSPKTPGSSSSGTRSLAPHPPLRPINPALPSPVMITLMPFGYRYPTSCLTTMPSYYPTVHPIRTRSTAYRARQARTNP